MSSGHRTGRNCRARHQRDVLASVEQIHRTRHAVPGTGAGGTRHSRTHRQWRDAGGKSGAGPVLRPEESAAEGHLKPMSAVSLQLLERRDRLGLKGPRAAEWLVSRGIVLPMAPNTWTHSDAIPD